MDRSETNLLFSCTLGTFKTGIIRIRSEDVFRKSLKDLDLLFGYEVVPDYLGYTRPRSIVRLEPRVNEKRTSEIESIRPKETSGSLVSNHEDVNDNVYGHTEGKRECRYLRKGD